MKWKRRINLLGYVAITFCVGVALTKSIVEKGAASLCEWNKVKPHPL
jgi:hypothetical protein